MMPVLTWLTSGLVRLAASNMSTNMVGVPYMEVHFSDSMAATQAAPLKLGQGTTEVAPCIRPPSVAHTLPKQ